MIEPQQVKIQSYTHPACIVVSYASAPCFLQLWTFSHEILYSRLHTFPDFLTLENYQQYLLIHRIFILFSQTWSADILQYIFMEYLIVYVYRMQGGFSRTLGPCSAPQRKLQCLIMSVHLDNQWSRLLKKNSKIDLDRPKNTFGR